MWNYLLMLLIDVFLIGAALAVVGLAANVIGNIITKPKWMMRRPPQIAAIAVLVLISATLAVIQASISSPEKASSSASGVPTTSRTSGSQDTATDTSSPSGTPSVTASAPPSPTLPYTADWSTGAGGWVEAEGWKVVSGMLLNDGTSYSQQLTVAAPINLGSLNDYVVQADIQLVRYTNSALASFGLVVRAPDGGGGYGLGHCAAVGIYSCTSNSSSSYVAVLWPAEDQGSPITAAPFQPKTSWHHYQAEAKGNQLRLLIDGGLVLSATDNRYLAGGRIGFWSNQAQINVKNFKVRAE